MRPARLAAAALALASAVAPAAACTIGSAGVAFGAYDPLGGGAGNSTGTISLDCHPSVQAPIVALGAGQSGSFASRRLSGGGWTLNYNLYADSGRTIVWGDGTGGSIAQTLSGGIVSAGVRRFSRAVYGRIPAGQNVGAASYGDTVFMTVTF